MVQGSTGTTIAGNYIGTDVTGSLDFGNALSGVAVFDGSLNTRIGSDKSDDTFNTNERNVISGNNTFGVFIVSATTNNTKVVGNFIGINASGNGAIANLVDGIYLESATNTLIDSNVISGNARLGVYVRGATYTGGVGGTGTVLTGNIIGLNSLGTTTIGNASHGIQVDAGSIATRIGTNADGVNDLQERNLISGNNGTGLAVAGAGTDDLIIRGNYIGTDTTGSLDRGNLGSGVYLANWNYDGPDVGAPKRAVVQENIISGNNGRGIHIYGPDSQNHQVTGNFVGTNSIGTLAVANSLGGILVDGGAKNIQIGTNGDGSNDVNEGNLISGNTGLGLWITGAGTNDTIVAGNFIGTNASGTAAIANTTSGVQVSGGALRTRIGTDGNGIADITERNVVSGNTQYGVAVFGAGTNDTVIAGNFVGTDLSGASRIANGSYGVAVFTSAQNTRIGTDGNNNGFDANERNVVSGNNSANVFVAAPQTTVAGNTIGLNATGTASLGNGSIGVYLWNGAQNVRVGTDGNGFADSLERNIISGNASYGIYAVTTVRDDALTFDNVIAGNYIGLNASGTIAVANAAGGMYLGGGFRNTRIGTDGSDDTFNSNERNVISGNSGPGVFVENSTTSGTVLAGNWIGLNATGSATIPNTGDGISLSKTNGVRIGTNGDGVSDDDERNIVSGNSGDGIQVQGGVEEIYSLVRADELIAGTLTATTVSGTIAQADLSDSAGPRPGIWTHNNPIPGGGGDNYAFVATGSITVTSAGNYSFAVSGDQGSRLKINGNTVISEDSLLNYTARYTSINLAAGTHSVEWTGFDLNFNSGFELSVNVGANITTIPNAANGWKVLGDPSPHAQIALNGNLTVTAYYSTGLINTATTIAGNYLGTNPAGILDFGNIGSGARIEAGATSNVIGGSPAEMNLISGNNAHGVYVSGIGTNDNRISGNIIGLNSDGTSAIGNSGSGVQVEGGALRTIIGINGDGMGDLSERNIISGNTRGVSVTGSTTSQNAIAGNWIGLLANGTSAVGNNGAGDGIWLVNGTAGNRVGTNADGVSDELERNTIAGHTFAGIAIYNANTNNNVVAGNWVGLNAAGTGSLANGQGIQLDFASAGIDPRNNRIGTNADGIRDDVERNVISGNGVGVAVNGNGTTGNVIAGNFIGTDVSGTIGFGNVGDGVFIGNSASNNTVGGTTASARNIISGNNGDGIEVNGSTSTGNLIQGNYVGTEVSGTQSLANSGIAGINVSGSSTIIGGNTPASRNIVSGNAVLGILIQNSTAVGNSIVGNYVGTNAAGTVAVPNVSDGIRIASAVNTILGGTLAGSGNLISGNRLDGIDIRTGASGTLIQGNFIGTDVTGLLPLGNGTTTTVGHGITIDGSSNTNTQNNQIGGTSAGSRNVIAANSGDGILFASASNGTISNNTIQGNYIGLNVNGLPLGNTRDGVRFDSGSGFISGNTVGGTTPAARNVLSANTGSGVSLIGVSTSNNSVIGNYVGTDATGIIDYGNAGRGVQISGTTGSAIVGNLISGNTSFGVSAGGATGVSILGNFIGTNAVGTGNLRNDNTGVWVGSGSINTTIGGATTADRNVIAFNQGHGISLSSAGTGSQILGNYIGVDASGLIDAGNLWAGIEVRNTPGVLIGDTSEGARNIIAGNGTGISFHGAGSINGNVRGNYIGLDRTGLVSLPGSEYGIYIGDGDFVGVAVEDSARNITVGGNVAGAGNVISGHSTAGVWIAGVGATGNTVAGNLIGTNSLGSASLANQHGVQITNGATANTIGGTSAASRNIISGNTGEGVRIAGTGTSDNLVLGNYIGTDATGNNALGNAGFGGGVYILDSASNNTIGGVAAGAGNVISGNSGTNSDGVEIELSSGNYVLGNRIGTNASGTTALANRQNGINLDRASGNFVGGSALGAGNVISGNTRSGVVLGFTGSTGPNLNTVQGNLIGTNLDGTIAMPNLEQGVLFLAGANGNLVGSDFDGLNDGAEGNLISGNLQQGVMLSSSTVANNAVRGNKIGTDITGTIDLGNQGSGVQIVGAQGTLVERNLISGNDGVGVEGNGAIGTIVRGNLINTKADGIAPLPNLGLPIYFHTGADSTTIGGIATAERNVIGFSHSSGVEFNSTGPLGSSVLGNYIGVAADGITDAGNSLFGVLVRNAPSITIGGTVAGARNIISGNNAGGVAFIGDATTSGSLSGNFIGVDRTGINGLPNMNFGVFVGDGDLIGMTGDSDARNVTIGGSVAGAGNVISGHAGPGVWIAGLNSIGSTVAGNLIGTNSLGLGALGNSVGVLVSHAATLNVIGGATSFSRNIISGNSSSGVRFEGTGTSNNTVRGNWIGLDVSGSLELGNSSYGVEIHQGASGNTLLDNVISGNQLDGVRLAETGSNTLRGNLIGTDASGLRPLGNGRLTAPRAGVWIVNSTGNIIGGSNISNRNVISGNYGDGVLISGISVGNAVRGNAIGTDAAGLAAISNTRHGIVLDGNQVTANSIGGPTESDGNLVYFNLASGLRLTGATSTTSANNSFEQNVYRGNIDLAIDVGDAGATLNDPGDADGLPNAPVIVSAFISSVGKLVVLGYGRPGRTVQIYSSAPSSNGRGQGVRRLGSFVEGSADDLDAGTGSYNFPLIGEDTNASLFRFEMPIGSPAAVEFGDLLTSVAVGSTSEFGNTVTVGDVASNQAPVISLSIQEATLVSGASLLATGSFADADSTSWSATVDFGDGTPLQVLELSNQRTFQLSHIYGTASPVNAPFQATVRIADNGGQEGTIVLPVTVQNQAPVNSFNEIVFDQAIDEGGIVTLRGAFEDTSDSETHTIEIKWGDGSISTQTLTAGLRTFTDTHSYPDDGVSSTARDNYRIEVTVRDESGESSSPFGLILTEVRNVRPHTIQLDAAVPTSVTEGQQFNFNGTFDDPGLKDDHEVVVDWGDGSAPQRLPLNAIVNQQLTRPFAFNHSYPNNPLAPSTTYTITVDVNDDDEPTTPTRLTRQITVTNALPVITGVSLFDINGVPLLNSTIDENSTASLTVNYSDAGILDTHTVTIDWGDGSEPTEIKPAAGTTQLVGLTHLYRDNAPGNVPYVITVKVADQDMAVGTFVTQTINLDVENFQPVMTPLQLYVRDSAGGWATALPGTAINEGDEVRITGAYTDQSELDGHTVSVQWATNEITSANVNPFDRTFEAIYKYRDDYALGTASDLETILVTVTDDDGGSTDSTTQVRVNNVAPIVSYVPETTVDINFIPLKAVVTDPGEEVFTYQWIAKLAGTSTAIQTGNASTFTVNRSLFDRTIQVDLQVDDDDTGTDLYQSVLVFGDDGPNTIKVTDDSFIGGITNLTIISFGADDIIDASEVTGTNTVVLDGGAGVDYLFGGAGNDTLVLRDGNDLANVELPSGVGGAPIVVNEAGNDIYLLSPNSVLTVRDRLGSNTLDFSRANISTAALPNLGVTFDLSVLTVDAFVVQDVAPELNLPESAQHQIRAQGLFAGLVGSSRNDRLTGRSNSTVLGGLGADVLVAPDGISNARFNGGADADVFLLNGTVMNQIDFEGDAGADVFNIEAITLGGIDFSGGADADVFNLTGNIVLVDVDFEGDAGADVFTIDGIVTGTIDFGGGADIDTFTLLEDARIEAIAGGASVNAIVFEGDSGADVFTISGDVIGGIDFGGGADADVFTLSAGASIGSIDFEGDAGADVFTIEGVVTGNIDFGGGADADVFTLSGLVQGSIDFEGDAGADVFTIGGVVTGTIDFGGGADADVFRLFTNATVGGIDFEGDSGADVLEIIGTVTGGIDFGGGADADVLQIVGTVTGGIDFSGGADADVFLLGTFGSVGSIDFEGDAGADVLQVSGIVTGGIDFDGGADGDQLFIVGAVQGALLAGPEIAAGTAVRFRGDIGADVLQIGSVITGGIDFGGGADADVFLLGNVASVGSIDFEGDAGADVLTISGEVVGGIDFGGGADADVFTLTASSSVGSIDFEGDTGADVLAIGGIVTGTIDFGGGADADVFTLSAGASVVGTIDFEGDSGADEMVIRGEVVGGIDFGGGADADVFVLTSTATVGGIDFEGDAGEDSLINAGAVGSIRFQGGEGRDTLRNDASNLTSIAFFGFADPNPLVTPTGDANLDTRDLFVNYGNDIGLLSFSGQAGDDVLLSKANNIGAIRFNGDIGADVLIVDGISVGEIDFSGGADADTLTVSGTLFGSIDFEGDANSDQSGSDTFINNASGRLDSNGLPTESIRFNGLGGIDAFRNDGRDWKELVFHGGDGDDRFQNNADSLSLISFDGGNGSDVLENNGNFVENIVFLGRDGDDIFVNDGSSVSSVIYFGSSGDDQFLNTGSDVQDVWFVDESGDNRFSNTGIRAKNLYFQGGSGSDTMRNDGAGSSNLVLFGNAGADRFINDIRGGGANDLRLVPAGSVGALDWPYIGLPPFSLPSVPTATADDADDAFLNRGSDVFNVRFTGDVGNDFFQNAGTNVTDVIFDGGAGDDQALNTTDGIGLSNFRFYGGIGNDAFQTDGASSTDLIFDGAEGNDSLYQNGNNTGAIEFLAGDGSNVLVNWGRGANLLRMIGGSGADRLQNNADAVVAIEFIGNGDTDALQNNGADVGTITMFGGDGTDTLLNNGNRVLYIDIDGGAGPDALVNVGSAIGRDAIAGTAFTGLRFNGGAGEDILRTQGSGLTTVAFDGGSDADSLVYNSTNGGHIQFLGTQGDDGFVFRGSATSIDVQLGEGDDGVVYAGEVLSSSASAPTVFIDGGLGDDTYEFPNAPKGYLNLIEPYGGASDTSRDSISFAAFTANAVEIDIASSDKQQISPEFWIEFASSSVMGIENVTGSQGNDHILGNDRSNVLLGASFATTPPTNPAPQKQAAQWVLLDFDSETDSGEYTYTLADRQEVLSGLKSVYYGTNSNGQIREYSDPERWFNVRFTEQVSEIPAGTAYATIRFNHTPPSGNPGGLSSEIDAGNVNLGGEIHVQVHGLLGGTALAPVLSLDGSNINGDFLDASEDETVIFGQRNPINSVANFVALSIKIAAHELGHLLGLRHYDSFGPIGSGVHTPPGTGSFRPNYTGPAAAYETFQHLISSPASVGSDRQNDIGNLFFGEREALKLAYAMADSSATRVSESAGLKDSLATAQAVNWTTISVPNTLGRGVNVNQQFFAETIGVSGSIDINPSTLKSENDFYALSGKRGDLITIEVASRSLSRLTDSGVNGAFNPDGYIDSIVRLYNSAGELVQYYDSTAVNDDEFESTDSILIDLVLPANDTYYIEVDSFARASLPTDPTDFTGWEPAAIKLFQDIVNDTDEGGYELFVYRFTRANASDGLDVIQGRGGQDTIIGGTGDDYNLYLVAGTLPTNAAAIEGVDFTHVIHFTDPTGDAWAATVNYGNSQTATFSGFDLTSGLPLVLNYNDNGSFNDSFNVSFTITNDDGRQVSGSFPITVNNANPTVASTVSGSDEGSSISVTSTGSDSIGDRDSLQYLITRSEATRNSATYIPGSTEATNNTASFIFADDGQYPVYIRVMDKDGGFVDSTQIVTVNNVAPTATVTNSGPISEGNSVTVSLIDPHDPSTADTQAGLRYAFSLSESAVNAATYATANASSQASFTFTDNGTYRVFARILDKNDAGTTYFTDVVVENVAPTAVLSNSGPILESQSVTIEFTGAADVSIEDSTAGFNYFISTDLSARDNATLDFASSSPTASFQFNDNGNYTVYGRVFDKDGGSRDYETVVVVGNQSPSVSITEISVPRQVNQPVTVTVAGTDPAGVSDTITYHYSIDRVGANAQVGVFVFATTSPAYTFTPTLTGSYVARVFATDEDGGQSATVSSNFAVGETELSLSVDAQDDGFKGVAGQLRLFDVVAASPGTTQLNYSIDWGDGSVTEVFSANQSPLLVSHRFQYAGVFSPVFTVSDSADSLAITLAGIEILDFEIQNEQLALGASDGGDNQDTLIIEPGSAFNTLAITRNGQAMLFGLDELIIPAGGIRVYSAAGDDNLIVRGTGQADSFEVTTNSIRLTQPQPVLVQFDDQLENVVLDGLGGNDSFTIENMVDGQILGGGGIDTIISKQNNVVTSWELSGTNSGVLTADRQLNFLGIEHLRGSDTAPDIFTVEATGRLTGSIDGGSGMSDSLTTLVSNGSVNLTTSLVSGVSGLVTDIESFGGSGGSLIGPSSVSTYWQLTGDGAGNLYDGTQTVNFTGFKSLVSGSGDDAFVASTAASFSSVNAGGGNDVIDASAVAAVQVNLPARTVTRVGNVLGFEKYIGSGTEARLSATDVENTWLIDETDGGTLNGSIVFEGFGRLVGGRLNDLFQIEPGGSITGQVTGFSGTNTLSFANQTGPVRINGLGSSATSGSVTNLAEGSLLVASYGQITSLVGTSNDGDRIVGPNANTNWTVEGVGSGKVGITSYAGFEHLEGKNGRDSFTLHATGQISSLNGQGGIDTLITLAGANEWIVSGIGAGTVNDITYSKIENLTGGSGDDLFALRTGGRVTGILDAGPGSNALSYEARTGAVSVNLAATTPIATDIATLLDRFAILIGGSGSDILTGSSARSMVIVGGTGNDTITGGNQRDILVGGGGADLLSGGGGEDIVIGGSIANGLDLSILRHIQSIWLDPVVDFGTRKNRLLSESLLSVQSLDSDAIDTLFGDEDEDWLIGDDVDNFEGSALAP